MRQILIFILLLFISINVLSDNPPKTYQQLKFEFKNIRVKNDYSIKPKFTGKQKALFGVAMGTTAFLITEYYFYNGNFKNYHKSILIGGGIHLITHIILQATHDPYNIKLKNDFL